jgi:hypothetical protein
MIYGKHRTELLHGNQFSRLIMQMLDHEASKVSVKMDIRGSGFIENWNQFKYLKDELTGATDFTPTKDIQRLLSKKNPCKTTQKTAFGAVCRRVP